MKSESTLTVRLPKQEKERLDRYCEENQRTLTEVVREFIRSLPE